MLVVGGYLLHRLYVAAFDPEHLQNPWERGKVKCRRAHGSVYDCGGMSAGVRASVDDCVCDRLSGNLPSWDSMREIGNARRPR